MARLQGRPPPEHIAEGRKVGKVRVDPRPGAEEEKQEHRAPQPVAHRQPARPPVADGEHDDADEGDDHPENEPRRVHLDTIEDLRVDHSRPTDAVVVLSVANTDPSTLSPI